MAKGKKAEDKPRDGATLTIDVETFVRTRDQVVTSLATLLDSIQTLSSGYIKHTNAVLSGHDSALDIDSAALSWIGDRQMLMSGIGVRAASPVKSAAGETKAQKKKRAHDPNAPKRPLTPYFLYMQTARPIIADDLGPDVAKGAVSAEGVRRWNAMAIQDKQLWSNAYTDNLKLYNARVHSYKNGNANAKDMTDEEAATYAETHNIGIGPIEPTADGQLTSEALLDVPSAAAVIEEEYDEAPAPKTPPKSKSKGKGKPKGSTSTSTPATAAPATIVPPAASVIVPPSAKASASAPEAEKSGDKKRKRPSKAAKADEPVASIEKEEAAAAAAAAKSTPKEKKSRKKAKSDA